MSTQTKKRRLPAWASSGISNSWAKATTRNGVFKDKAAEAPDPPDYPEETRARPTVEEQSKATGIASSSKAKEAKISSAGGGSGSNKAKTRLGIKDELDDATDTNAAKGKYAEALSTSSDLQEEFKIGKSISVLKSTRESQENLKEETVDGDSLITNKSTRGKQFSTKEESEDMNQRRRRLSGESPQGESKDALKKQNTDGLKNDGGKYTPTKKQVKTEVIASQLPANDGGKYTSTTHHIKTEVITSQPHENGKVHHNSPNEPRTHSEDVEDNDTAAFSATQKKENRSRVPFSRLLEGVMCTISGLVNPERAELREMAIDMGAKYRPSWSSDSTLLIAAFANTPSFSQVKAVGGTIVHKDWIVECYKRKELVPVEKYMMNVGNPWRAGHDVDECPVIGVEKDSPCQTERMQAKRKEIASDDHKKLLSTSMSEDGTRTKVPGLVKSKATRAEIHQWFLEDLETLRSWLEAQQEKPEHGMLDYTAAQGLVACLEDAIRSLEGNEGLKLVVDSWAFIPRAIKELEEELSQVSRMERLVGEAERIKSIYISEIQKMGLGDPPREDAQTDDDATEIISDTDSRDPADYYSDDTEELDEDEITKCQIRIMHRFALD